MQKIGDIKTIVNYFADGLPELDVHWYCDHWCRKLQVKLPYVFMGANAVAFLDISGQVELVESWANMIFMHLQEENLDFDYIVNPVSKSNALGHALANHYINSPYKIGSIVARKATGSAGASGQYTVEYKSVTTPNTQFLTLTEEDNRKLNGARVLLLDDVYADGQTMSAVQKLVQQAGAEVVKSVVVAIEEDCPPRDDLIYLFKLPRLEKEKYEGLERWIITYPMEHEKNMFKNSQVDPNSIRVITDVKTRERHLILIDPEKCIMEVAGRQRLNNGG